MKPGYSAPLNVALRATTLSTRFALVFVLAKYLDAASVGYYGLFTAAVGYALLGVGLDFYIYSTREIAKVAVERQGALLKGQAALVGVLYVVLVPIILFALSHTGLPVRLIWWFLPILVLEHLNQELYRLLIILSRQISASVLLFVRQGSWAIATVGLMALDKESRNLGIVMLLWTGAGAAAAAAGLWKLQRLQLGGWREPVDWLWIRRGIAVSSTFIAATLAVRGVQTVDRYWLESLAGIKVVGAYVLFFGVASSLSVFLDAAIFSFYYPELVQLANQSRLSELHHHVRRTALLTTAASLGFALVSSLLLPFLLNWIGRDVYQAQIGLYYWIMAAMIVYSLGLVPHYALYAQGHDRPIIVSHIASLGVFVVATLALTRFSRTYAVPIGVFTAMALVMLWKTTTYIRITRRYARQGEVLNLESGLP